MKNILKIRAMGLVAMQVAIPSSMVVGARWMSMRDGPARASATTPASAATPEAWSVEAEGEIDAQARRLLEAGQARIGVPIERDPFHSTAFGGSESVLDGLLPVAGSGGEIEEAPKAPALRLSSIASGRDVVAVINGAVRRVGDSVGGEWTIERIDHSAGTVTIEHPSGATETIAISR